MHSKKIDRRLIVIFAVLVFLFSVGAYQGSTLEITHLDISTPRVPELLKGKEIALLSDLHGHLTESNRLNLLKSLKDASPAIILIAGDMVDSQTQYWPEARALLEALPDIAPTYYSFGNHEIANLERGADFKWLNELGITLLRNKSATIEVNGVPIVVSGLDDRVGFEFERDFILEMNNLHTTSAYQILISHRPEYGAEYEAAGFNLVVSGHAHGGQVRLPFLGAFYAPHQGFFPAFTQGLIHLGDTQLVVSRGLGNRVIIPRLFNPRELVLLKL